MLPPTLSTTSTTPSAARIPPARDRIPHALSARPRFLSQADCEEIAHRLARYAEGGGYTITSIASTWRGNVRWARNQISTSGEVRTDHVQVARNLTGAMNGIVQINQLTDAALVAAVRRAERLARLAPEHPESDLLLRYIPEPFTAPVLFHDTTYQLDASQRAAAAIQLAKSAADADMLSAGYIEVSAHSLAQLTSWGQVRYFQWTHAQYSVTVRDPTGTGSGWAGVDGYDWATIDAPQLSAIALEKCLTSRHPVAIEPGRYTTILEPQAVADFVGLLVQSLDRDSAESLQNDPFMKTAGWPGMQLGYSKLGEQVVDRRITISCDPLDPVLGVPPFAVQYIDPFVLDGEVYHPATWIERGVLTQLPYNRNYAIRYLGKNTGLPNSGAFRMSGGETSVAEMIATTPRGLLVTRFDSLWLMEPNSMLVRGYTRDGLWMIEHGKISKPAKNLAFTESVLFALNNVEQLGMPQRVFSPPGNWNFARPAPVVAPSLKVRDFSFTATADAV